MDEIAKKYARCVLQITDINEHLPVLLELSVRHASIAELGVRNAVSTWAFLYGLCLNQKQEKYFVCLDKNEPPCLGELRQWSAQCGIRFEFFKGNSATTLLPVVDMMFIDTWHVCAHLKRELELHHARVRHCIVLHDTESDKLVGESVREKHDIQQQSIEYGYAEEDIRKGLLFAMDEFLSSHPEWRITQHFPNNNGLTILERR